MNKEEFEVITNLIKLDNYVMKDNLSIDDVLKEVANYDITLNNCLIIYDGNINITKKILNSEIYNCVLYPNNSYLAINKFLLRNRNDLELYTEKNDFTLRKKQDEFKSIVVFDDEQLFESVKNNYNNVIFIK